MSPHRLGNILENYLSRAGLQPRIQEQRILDAWQRIVGKAIAEMTEPVRVRNRVLQVKVTSSVWMHELQFHKKLIIQKLNEYTGETVVQDLWFFIGEKQAEREFPLQGGEKKQDRQTRDPSREERNRIEEEVSRLEDPEMKEILSRVFSRALTWKKGRGMK